MKHIIILILTGFIFSCGQQTAQRLPDENSSVDNYINHPNNTDSLCLKDLEKAKKDVAKGKIAFCSPMGFGTGYLRHQTELEELCKRHNLTFQYEHFGDVIMEGQTQGCYGSYMDNIISKKFGTDFKRKLEDQADSILIANAVNDTIQYWDCDVRPHQVPKEKHDGQMYIPINKELQSKFDVDKPDEYGHYNYPFMEISFIIETSGKTSDFTQGYISAGNDPSIQKYSDVLWKDAMIELQKTIWQPGEIKGHKVRTRNNVRVYFMNEKR